MKRWDAEGWTSWRNLDARRVIYTASVRGEDRGEEKEFLYVKYDGRDAIQVRSFPRLMLPLLIVLYRPTDKTLKPSLLSSTLLVQCLF